jgi:CRISPR-associated endonuclease/helicase Cas3
VNVLKDNIESCFKNLTGLRPFKFQVELAENLLNNNNVILQAPTGAGKTWASILPFLSALEYNYEFPKKMIYSLPMRVLANSLYKTVSENEFIKQKQMKVSLQTGEQPNDKYFLDGDITFTTIDQSLSSILSIPLGLSKRQANINAGAFIGTYIVFDEFHLLDPKKSLSTLFHLLKMMGKFSPFCLMTATLSNSLLKEFAKEVNAQIVSVEEHEILNIPSQRGKERIIQTIKGELSSDDVLREHISNSRSIVICNTVKKCQKLYLELEQLKKKDARLKNTELICIHSRFFGSDRKIIENQIVGNSGASGAFSKTSDVDAILISTQVIEVGIDISCSVLHTEISPINSLIQRIGRCARFESETGRVFIYNVESPLPYEKILVEDTFHELHKYDNQNIDFLLSQKIIDAVLSNREIEELGSIRAGNRKKEIQTVWETVNKADAHKLIREIDSISIVILDEVDDNTDPYIYESISIFKWSLIGFLKKIESDEWKIKAIRENNFIDESYSNFENTKYTLQEISPDDIIYESLVIVNNCFIKYDSKIGMNFIGEGNESSKIINIKSKKDLNLQITMDTYEEHIDYLILAYNNYFRGKLGYLLSKLNNYFNEDILFDSIVEFMIIMHDYGKLNDIWQKKAIEFQRKKTQIPIELVLAHTDFCPADDDIIKFPQHAGVGARISLLILPAFLKYNKEKTQIATLLAVVATSIMRHHSPLGVDVPEFNITSKHAKQITSQLFKKYFADDTFMKSQKENLCNLNRKKPLSQYLVNYENDTQIFLYFVLVRILRICDQKSFEFK